jgi:hypothetical protein
MRLDSDGDETKLFLQKHLYWISELKFWILNKFYN